MSVAHGVVHWFQQNVFDVLVGGGSPRKRVSLVADHLRIFYADGDKSCVTDVLSIPGGPEELRAGLKNAMEAWLKAFTDIARESGMPSALAKARAEEAIIRIEGSLVLTRVLGERGSFEKVLKLLPDLLTTG